MFKRFLYTIGLSAVLASPAFGQNAEIVKALPKPTLTAKQRALLQEMGQDSRLNGNISSFIGQSPQRILQQPEEMQMCFAAQFIVFQELTRNNLPPPALAFAQAGLKREDWCANAVRAATNKTVAEVLSYDGINSLFFVLSKDMENRLIAANLAAAGSAPKAR